MAQYNDEKYFTQYSNGEEYYVDAAGESISHITPAQSQSMSQGTQHQNLQTIGGDYSKNNIYGLTMGGGSTSYAYSSTRQT